MEQQRRSMRDRCSHIMRQGRRSEATESCTRYLPIGKKVSSYRSAHRVPLFSLSVCVCVTFVILLIARAVRFHTHGIYGSGRVWANAWDVFRRPQPRGGRGAAADFVVSFGRGGIFSIYFLLRTHTAGCKYETTLPRLPPY